MRICSRCKQETDVEPYDRKADVLCYECRNKCEVCGHRTVAGHSCPNCERVNRIKNLESILVIDKTKMVGQHVNKADYKRVVSSVITHEGENLSDEAGVNYMRKFPDRYGEQLKKYEKA